jgi:predicted CoA-binding protein
MTSIKKSCCGRVSDRPHQPGAQAFGLSRRSYLQTGAAKDVRMQEGIDNEAAAAEARKAGLEVIMDRWMHKQHIKLHGGE